MNYVIIGGSIAAVGAVEGIRQVDRQSPITVVSAENHFVYSRPLISYLLLGKATRQSILYRPEHFFQDNGCEVLYGREAKSVDVEKKQVILNGGRVLPYDRLLLATGSEPFIPATPGLSGVQRVHTFLTLDDALALQEDLQQKPRVLIVGAGLIGLKCAEGIAGMASSIMVVDLASRVLSSILDEEGSKIVQDHLERQGLNFVLGQSVQSFEGNLARLSSGQQIEFDVLVMAVGVRARTLLAKNAGADVQRAIVIDSHMRTSLKDVFAAGDCTQSVDVSSGQQKVMALLPVAYMQGECAGVNMAGGEKVFDKAMAMNAMGLWGLHIITAGTYEGEVFERKGEGTYKKLFVKDGLLRGYILIGDVARAGIYTSLIRDRTPLSTIDFPLILDHPSLLAFSRAKREELLGGVSS